MRVGFLGLGRLGLPIAAVLSKHHRVVGYDPDPSTERRLEDGHPWEADLSDYLGDISLAHTPDAATFDADIVVICVPTPHDPRLDGTHDTGARAPFDLSYVRQALRSTTCAAPHVLMSTVLPGDTRKMKSMIRGDLVYSPAFPAMGTTIRDVLNPEFILAGAYREIVHTRRMFGELWGFLDVPVRWMSYETAELAKMAYNTAIGGKLALANTVGWLAEEVGADGGEVMRVLSDASRRITSPAYLQPGLGDGGACHPRDQIALSWLARAHEVYDFFGKIIDQRSAHSRWVAEKAEELADTHDMDRIVILGSAYKPDSSLTDGSPAKLLANQTGWEIVERPPSEPCVIVIGVAHTAYQTMDFSGHAVLDPWGIVPGAVQIGRRTDANPSG